MFASQTSLAIYGRWADRQLGGMHVQCQCLLGLAPVTAAVIQYACRTSSFSEGCSLQCCAHGTMHDQWRCITALAAYVTLWPRNPSAHSGHSRHSLSRHSRCGLSHCQDRLSGAQGGTTRHSCVHKLWPDQAENRRKDGLHLRQPC